MIARLATKVTLVTLGTMVLALAGSVGCSDDSGSSGNNENSPVKEICDNGIDDDGDGLTDGEDKPECDESCDDWDKDGYRDVGCGGTDCQDRDPKISPGAAEKCGDGIDNNCDGLTDAEDTASCPPGCEDADQDGYPNQSCGGSDCVDSDERINPGAQELCDDGRDNDCDGLTDCDDGDCSTADVCVGQEEDCTDGQDDDGDNLTDCEDADCNGEACGPHGRVCQGGSCVCPGGATELACDDGQDNDCDGLTDLDDTQDCECRDGETRQCGVSDVGLCEYGTQQCVGSHWAACQGNVDPSPEQCDGLDENCNGTCNDGTFLPRRFDALEWIPSGWWDIGEGVVDAWDGFLAFYDMAQNQVTGVASLQDVWDALGTSGTQPPAQGIDAMIAVPEGLFALPADALFVSAGSSYYLVDQQSKVWTTGPVSDVFGDPMGFTHLDAGAYVPPGSLAGSTTDYLLVADHDEVWVYDIANGTWSGPLSPADAFCPPGAQGPCPP